MKQYTEHGLKLIKISDFTYRLSGIINFTSQTQKTVIVDGEKYIRYVYEPKSYDFDYNFLHNPGHFIKHEIIHFEWIGIKKVTFYDNRYLNYVEIGRIGGSQSDWVNKIELAYELEIEPLKITNNIHHGKYNDFMDLEEYLLETSLIDVIVLQYGYNNSVWVKMPFKSFIKLNIQYIINYMPYSKYLVETLIKLGYLPKETMQIERFTNEQKRVIMLNLYQKKINYQKNRR